MLATAPRTGSPRAALAHGPFRWVFAGSFASNIGTWMQNAVLLAWVQSLTGSGVWVGAVTFAQLGPTLILAPVGGVLADRMDRRALMGASAAIQGLLSGALAVVATSPHPSMAAIVTIVGGIGVASAMTVPSSTASLPALVGYADLPGAVALNSAQMNASRVVGPILALLPALHAESTVFAVNALTYGFVIVAVVVADFDGRPAAADGSTSAWTRFAEGLAAARRDHVVRRVLVTVSVFSLGSLAFIYQMPGFARLELGIPKGDFPLLLGTFGLGAAVGAMCVGTLLAHVPRTVAVRVALGAFAVLLGAFALAPNAPVAFVAVGFVGFAYFVVITSLSTALQQAVDDAVRGRVMGLWMMGWAGLVPVGSLLAGVVIDHVRPHGHVLVMLCGAAIAAALIPYASIDPANRPLSSRRARRRDTPTPSVGPG